MNQNKENVICVETHEAISIQKGLKTQIRKPIGEFSMKCSKGDKLMVLSHSDNPNKKTYTKVFCDVVITKVERGKLISTISVKEAIKEGIEEVPPAHTDGSKFYKLYTKVEGDYTETTSPVKSFKSMWDSKYEKTPFNWDANPDVVILTVKKIQ